MDQEKIIADEIYIPQTRTLEAAVLQLCKQIHREAVPILYSRNVFHFSGPESVMWFIYQVGSANTKLIRYLDIFIPSPIWADQYSWLEVLDELPQGRHRPEEPGCDLG
jgi:hypothetical protein